MSHAQVTRGLRPVQNTAGAVAVLIAVLLAGCSSYRGIPRSQFIPSQPAQAWAIDAPPETVWSAVQYIASLETGHEVLTQSGTSRTLTWLSPERASRDLFCDAAAVRSSISPVSTPMTTVWVERGPVTNRCCLHVKRVYISTVALSGVGPSRGEYESLFVSALQTRLPGVTVTPIF